jgi:hypothetical protein
MEPFVNEVDWDDIPREKPLFAILGRYNRPDVQAVVLKWLDAHAGDSRLADQGFRDWKPTIIRPLARLKWADFARYWLRNPPPGPFLQKVAEDQARFAVVQALTTPIVIITDVRVERESGQWKSTATVANEGYLDTSMEQARRAEIAKPDKVTLALPDGENTDD